MVSVMLVIALPPQLFIQAAKHHKHSRPGLLSADIQLKRVSTVNIHNPGQYFECKGCKEDFSQTLDQVCSLPLIPCNIFEGLLPAYFNHVDL